MFRREKVFGSGRPRPMSRSAKLALTAKARAMMRPTAPRKHYGQVTAKTFAVLQALLWGFHNAKSGLCFPSLEAIAEKAGCSRATAHRAIVALEDAGLLTWVHRIKRALGRVLRTSNGYVFAMLGTESQKTTGTELPSLILSKRAPEPPLLAALARLKEALQGRDCKTEASR